MYTVEPVMDCIITGCGFRSSWIGNAMYAWGDLYLCGSSFILVANTVPGRPHDIRWYDDDHPPGSRFIEMPQDARWYDKRGMIIMRADYAILNDAARTHLTFGGRLPIPSRAVRDVTTERMRQINDEGFSDARDDAYNAYELELAATAYVAIAAGLRESFSTTVWPWDRSWWKPSADNRRNLVKAAALIVAAIDRCDRAALRAAERMQP